MSAESRNGSYNAEAERKQNVVGERIAEARKRKKWSQVKLTSELNQMGISITQGSVAKWEIGLTVPTVYQFLALCEALELDEKLSWFKDVCRRSEAAEQRKEPELNEEGERLVAQYRRDLICSGNYRPEQILTEVIKYRDMPIAMMPAAAGTGNLLDDADCYETVSFPEDQVNPKADVGIRVSGDSMEPVFHDGQIVWVERCSQLSPGEVGIFILDGNAYIKAYHEQTPEAKFRELYTDSSGMMRMQPVLISYNRTRYAPIVVSPYQTLRTFGKVLK